MNDSPPAGGDPLRPTPAEVRARQKVHPALHRATGQITFRPLRDEPSRDQPNNLCAFLRLDGITSVVVEEVPTMPEIHLQGLPNLDQMQELI